MKIHKIIIPSILAAITLSGCATIHEMSAPKDEKSKQAREAVQQKQNKKLEDQTSLWLGEAVTVASVNKGVIQTNFIVETKRGKQLPCFYTGFFGVNMSNIVCGGKRE